MTRTSYWADPLPEDSEESLEHFGVKGMKWGVRKKRTGDTLSRVGKAAKSTGRAAAQVPKVVGHDIYRKASDRGQQMYEKGDVQKHHTIVRAVGRSVLYGLGSRAVGTALVFSGRYTTTAGKVIKAADIGHSILNSSLAANDTVRNMSLRAYEHDLRKANKTTSKKQS
ncbi:hypothetical protein BIHU0010003c01_00014 [Bifidobacterium phage BitterVaud1]|nr:hypothetical protein BIHU0010003c01_00014 [Bifidobacterium phage BitterVaud1]